MHAGRVNTYMKYVARRTTKEISIIMTEVALN